MEITDDILREVEQIREKVEALVNEAIELLEANYNMDDAKYDNPAYMAMLNLNSSLMDLYYLDEEGLKTEE